MARAEAQRAAGERDAAITTLAAAMDVYTQDYSLALRLGYLCLSAGRAEEARRYYALAAALSGPGGDADQGLGEAALALGAWDEARAAFERVLAARPGDPAARAGLDAARAAWPQIEAWVGLTGHVWSGHPAKRFAGAGAARVAWRAPFGLHLGAGYRGLYFVTRSEQVFDPPVEDLLQNEVWASLGYDAPRWGLRGTYGWARPQGQPNFAAHVAAAQLRITWGVDLRLAQAISVYPDHNVLQSSLRLGVGPWAGFSAAAQGRLQWSDGAAHGAGELVLGWDSARFGAWAGGTLGRELQPVLPELHALYNLPEAVGLGARGGLRLSVGGGFSVLAEYELRRLEGEPEGLDPYTTQLHLVTVGLAMRR
ncbi:MAG: hypothetical protein H6730_20995 [Deltaproteobacteria bacterium]|nr:hypothetical protein [Deltaproteobacteria bacterium]